MIGDPRPAAPRLRLENCLGQAFEDRCAALARLVAESYEPDLVVAIERGGVAVADEMRRHPEMRVPAVRVVASRPGTRRKRALGIGVVARLLPQGLLDRLRVWEIERGAARFEANRDLRPRQVDIPVGAEVTLRGAERVLVVDDSVDSGSTVVSVVAAISRLNGSAELRVAALTQTYARPLVEPDFVMTTGVVLRLPTSADAERGRVGPP